MAPTWDGHACTPENAVDAPSDSSPTSCDGIDLTADWVYNGSSVAVGSGLACKAETCNITKNITCIEPH